MLEALSDQLPETCQQQATSTRQPRRTTQPLQRTTDPTHLPLYVQAWGNLPPPWLRLSVQRQEAHEGETLQGRDEPFARRRTNTTGLPGALKAGVESLSGLSMDDVQVHRNSSKPAAVQALAYTQGTEIHLAPGQEQHLAHEAWHVVQQKQGRVTPTIQFKGIAMNDDKSLEQEAEAMGARASQVVSQRSQSKEVNASVGQLSAPLQLVGATISARIYNAQIMALTAAGSTRVSNAHPIHGRD